MTNQPTPPPPPSYGSSAAPAGGNPNAPVKAPPGTDFPGKTLGIVGLIAAIVIPLVGLILSIVAKVQSKRAGFKNTPALADIIIGIVLIAIYIIVWIIIGVALAGVVGQCADLGPGTHYVDGVTYTCS